MFLNFILRNCNYYINISQKIVSAYVGYSFNDSRYITVVEILEF